jgi:hypothetical protein
MKEGNWLTGRWMLAGVNHMESAIVLCQIETRGEAGGGMTLWFVLPTLADGQ